MTSIKRILAGEPTAEEALKRVGIHTAAQLLEAGATASGRMHIMDRTGISEERVCAWVHQTDVLRVEGVSMKLAELLVEAGVTTVPKLAYHSESSLRGELMHVHRAVALPPRADLERIIANAKLLPKIVRH